MLSNLCQIYAILLSSILACATLTDLIFQEDSQLQEERQKNCNTRQRIALNNIVLPESIGESPRYLFSQQHQYLSNDLRPEMAGSIMKVNLGYLEPNNYSVIMNWVTYRDDGTIRSWREVVDFRVYDVDFRVYDEDTN